MQSYSSPEATPSTLLPKRQTITTQLRLLTVNDIYTLRDTNGVGGYATLKTVVRAHERPYSLFVVNGDVLGGSQLCESFHGEPAVAILNAIEPDIAAVGNHEFDYGENQLESLMRDSQFPWLGGNIRRKSQGGRLMRGITPYVMYDYTIDSTGAVVGRKQVFDPMAASLLVAKPDWDTQDYPPIPLQELHSQAERTASARSATAAAAAAAVAASMKGGRVPAVVPDSAPASAASSGAVLHAGVAPVVTAPPAPASGSATTTAPGSATATAASRSRANSVNIASPSPPLSTDNSPATPAAAPSAAAAAAAFAAAAAPPVDEDDNSLAAKVYLSTPCSRSLFNPPLLRALSSSKRASDVFAAQGGSSGSAGGVGVGASPLVGLASPAEGLTLPAAAGAAGVTGAGTSAGTGATAGVCEGEELSGVGPYYTLRIGFIGVCTVHTPTQSYPTKDVIFDDAAESAAHAAGVLKNVAHCDLVVGLTHLALREDIQVLQATPDIALSVGGHEHTPILTQQDTRFVYKTGQNAQYLGIVDFNITFPIPPSNDSGADSDPEAEAALGPRSLSGPSDTAAAAVALTAAAEGGGKAGRKAPVKVVDPVMMLPSFQLIANMGYEPDKATESVICVYEAKLEELLAQGPDPMRVVATITGTTLETRTTFTRAAAASGASMVADAILSCHREVAQAACINGGFVRGDTFYPPGHALLYKELMQELPFPKTTSVLRLTGAVWKEGLEQQLMHAPKPTGAHPHYSRNVEIEYDPSLAVGSRVLSMRLNGEPVDPDTEYTVAMTVFMAGGGDGLVAFQKATVLPQGDKDKMQVLAITTQYLDTFGGIYEPDSRENVRAVASSR